MSQPSKASTAFVSHILRFLVLLSLLASSYATLGLTSQAAQLPQPRLEQGTEGRVGAAGGRLAFEGLDSTAGVALAIPAGALERDVTIRVEPVAAADLPPLDPGMINVTAPGGGYRFLPAGTQFNQPARIEIPLQAAYAGVAGVRTYFWDVSQSRWIPLEKLRVDGKQADRVRVVSQVHHFTTMINAVLVAPETPTPLQFNPNALKDIAAADPSAGMDLIAPPVANNEGTAELSYPLRLPAGRGAFSPALSLSYSSSRGNGWLGVGWDLPVPRIEVDTRWGVPAYDGTERYMLNGQALVPVPVDGDAQCYAGTGPTDPIVAGQYASRVESFQRILQCETAGGLHWEVTNKDGLRFEYGSDAESRLASYQPGEEDHVAVWYLRRVVDPNGNATHYRYQTDASDPAAPGEPYVQKYLAEIQYTEHADAPAAYSVRFTNNCESRQDVIVNARWGFKTLTRCRPSEIRVTFQDPSGGSPEPIRTYLLNYQTGAFGKTILSNVQLYGADFAQFYEHSFDYTGPQSATPFENAANQRWPVNGSGVGLLGDPNMLLADATETADAVSLGLGVAFEAGTSGASAGCQTGISGGATYEQADPGLSLSDVNGDGIGDRIWLQNGLVRLVLGQTAPTNAFDGPYDAQGLSQLGSEAALSGQAGSNIGCTYGPASVSGGMSFSVRKTDTLELLADADGDGLVDLTDGSTLYRGLPQICRDGNPPAADGSCSDGLRACPDANALCFEPATVGGLVRVQETAAPDATAAGEALDWDFYNAARQRMQEIPEIAREMYRLDPVIRWDARRTGEVVVTARARRKYTGGADGVSVTLLKVTDPTRYLGTQELGQLLLPPDAQGWRDVPGAGVHNINFGEALLLVIDTIDDVPISASGQLLDEIELGFYVEYRQVCPPGQPCRNLTTADLSHRDATGQLSYVFEFPGDLRISELPRLSYWQMLPPIGPPRPRPDGGYDYNRVAGTVNKLAPTETPVHVRIRCESLESQRADDDTVCPVGTLLAEKVFAPDETGPVPLTATLPAPFRPAYRVAGTRVTADGDRRAFLWNPNPANPAQELLDLGTLGGLSSLAFDVNDYGQVVGRADDINGAGHAFLWSAAAGMLDLGTLGGSLSQASAVNNQEQVVGYSRTDLGHDRAFLWTRGNGMIELGTLGGKESYAEDINDQGQVVGYSAVDAVSQHAFLWTDVDEDGVADPGEMQDLGTLGGANSRASGINAQGQVVGQSETASGALHAFLWTPGGTGGVPGNPQMQDLGTLGGNPLGSSWSDATAINAAGQVVGRSPNDDGAIHAFLWTPGGTGGVPHNPQMQDLGAPGGSRSAASDVNAHGHVTGSFWDEAGARHPFVWLPEQGMTVLNPPAADSWATGISGPLAYEPVRLMFEVDGENGAEVPPSAIQWAPEIEIVSVHDIADVRWPEPEASQVVGLLERSPGVERATVWVDTQRDGRWQAGQRWELGTLGGYHSAAAEVNVLGQIAGNSNYTTTTLTDHAFFWAPVDRMIWESERRMLNFNPPYTDTIGSAAEGINDYGQVVGTFYEGFVASVPHGFLLTPGGEVVDFGGFTTAHDVNNRGQVVGDIYVTTSDRHAFLWTDDDGDDQPDSAEILDLGTLAGTDSRAFGVNDNGDVVGWTDTTQGRRAFLWTPEQGMRSLGSLGGISIAYAVNDHGWVVGTSQAGDGTVHPFLWTPTGGMVDLYPQADDFQLNAATGVNDHGQVIGQVAHDGVLQAFVWQDTNGNGQADSSEMQFIDPRPDANRFSASGINNGTAVDYVKQERAVFVPPEAPWRETPAPLYRVHPARELVPFRTEAPDRTLRLTATVVNPRHELIVGVTGDHFEGELERLTLGPGDLAPGLLAATQQMTLTLREPGLYYVRGYTEASFDPASGAALRAELVGLSYLALVHNDLSGVMTQFSDLNQSGLHLAVVAGSRAETLAGYLFPNAQLQSAPDLDAAVAYVLQRESDAVFAPEASLRQQILEPAVADAAFLGFPRGDAQPLVINWPVDVNLLRADWSTRWRSTITTPLALQNMVGEVHYAFEPYAGGHHGFFYGQFNGEKELTCIGPDPCVDAPVTTGNAASASGGPVTLAVELQAALPDTCDQDSDEDGLPDCFDPTPYLCTAESEVRLDVNGDQVINIVDIELVAADFGKTSESPAWNPDRDLNGDGRIDRQDVELAARFWKQDPRTVDSDGDGMPDCADGDPDRPEDFDGVDDHDGVPEPEGNDADGDGFGDDEDACPFAPEDADGDLDGDGCPEDNSVPQNGPQDDPDGSTDIGPDGDAGERARRFGSPGPGGTPGDGGPCFTGTDPSVSICSDGTHPSRNSSGGGGGPFSPPDGIRRSWTFGHSRYLDVGVGLDDLGIPLSLHASAVFGTGLTYGDRDYLDWNGDGLPDRLSPNVVTLAGRDETYELGVDCILPLGQECLLYPAIRSSVSGMLGFGLGAGAGGAFNFKTDAQGRVVSQGWSDLNFGVNAHASQSRTLSDRIDVNGDGLPDLVHVGAGEYAGRLLVRLNLGYRLGAEEDWGPLALGTDAGRGALRSQLFLTEAMLDAVLAEDPLYDSDNLSTGIDVGVNARGSVPGFGGGFKGGRSESATLVQSARALADLNGDGLVDVLLKNPQSDTLYVRYNRGDGFGAVESYSGMPAWAIAPIVPEADTGPFGFALDWINQARTQDPDALSVSGSAGATWSGSVEATVFFVKASMGYSHSDGHRLVEMQLSDVNGDGLPDRVLRAGAEGQAAVQVQENRFDGANLLSAVHRPLGGRIDLAYEQSTPTQADPNARWMLASAVLRNDDAFPAADRTQALSVTFEYESPFYDRFERQFLGFETVRTLRADGRVEETVYANRDYWLAGQPLITRVLDGPATLMRETENVFAPERLRGDSSQRQACLAALPLPLGRLANATLDAAGRTPCDTWFVKPTRTTTRWFEGGSTPKEWTMHYEAYDAYGNVTRVRDQRDEGAQDDVVATITYAQDPPLLDAYVVDRSASIDVRQESASGARLRFRRGTYDDRGNLIRHEIFADAAGNRVQTLDLAYDATGFMTAVTDTLGYAVTYTPDPALNQLSASVQDSFGLSSSSTYDYRFQAPTQVVDANGQTRANTYDQFGRITQVQGPYELAAGTHSLSITYAHAGPLPAYAVTTNRAVVPGTLVTLPDIRTAIFVDGLGRQIQAQVDAEVDRQVGRVVSGKMEFDAAGRQVREGLPVFRTATTIQFESLSLTPGMFTEWEHDVLDRVTRLTEAGNRVTTRAYDVAPHPRLAGATTRRTRITDPNGEVRFEHRDAADRLVAVVQRLDGRDLVTSYAYRPTGELLSIQDALDHSSSFEYDLLGRRTAVTTPDAGRLELAYDANGNLIERTDQVLCPEAGDLLARCGNSQKIHYTYDRNRLVSVDYPNTPDVSYTYGDAAGGACTGQANVQGRVCRVQDGAGTEYLSYGALGEITTRSRVTPGEPGGPATRTFTNRFVYDSFGRLLSMTYPDGEVLTYNYDGGGRVRRVEGTLGASTTVYVDQILYDRFGQRTRAVYASGNVTETYQYEPDTQRLDIARVTSAAVAGTLRQTDYTYDPVGNILSVQDARASAAPFLTGVTRDYAYDDLHRLTGMQMTASEIAATVDVDAAYTYDDVGNLLSQSVQRQEGATPLTAYPSRTWTYAYGAPSHPNLPDAIGPYSFTYDARGSILTSTRAGGSDAPLGAVYTWDDLGRLATSQRQGGSLVTAYTYDAGGQRVRKQTPATVADPADPYDLTVYPNPYYSARFAQEAAAGCAAPPCWEEVVSRSKHVYVGDQRVAVTGLVVDPATAANAEDQLGYLDQVRHFFHTDPVQSTTLLTDESGARMQELDYLPFGEVLYDRRATGDPGLPQSYLFDGKELDPETGLQYFGARYYDPRLGRWISADPLYRTRPEGGLADPVLLNLFAFGRDNPVGYGDPTGLDPCAADQSGCKKGAQYKKIHFLKFGDVLVFPAFVYSDAEKRYAKAVVQSRSMTPKEIKNKTQTTLKQSGNAAEALAMKFEAAGDYKRAAKYRKAAEKFRKTAGELGKIDKIDTGIQMLQAADVLKEVQSVDVYEDPEKAAQAFDKLMVTAGGFLQKSKLPLISNLGDFLSAGGSFFQDMTYGIHPHKKPHSDELRKVMDRSNPMYH
jgi:RHS repeat-associated protein